MQHELWKSPAGDGVKSSVGSHRVPWVSLGHIMQEGQKGEGGGEGGRDHERAWERA